MRSSTNLNWNWHQNGLQSCSPSAENESLSFTPMITSKYYAQFGLNWQFGFYFQSKWFHDCSSFFTTPRNTDMNSFTCWPCSVFCVYWGVFKSIGWTFRKDHHNILCCNHQNDNYERKGAISTNLFRKQLVTLRLLAPKVDHPQRILSPMTERVRRLRGAVLTEYNDANKFQKYSDDHSCLREN